MDRACFLLPPSSLPFNPPPPCCWDRRTANYTSQTPLPADFLLGAPGRWERRGRAFLFFETGSRQPSCRAAVGAAAAGNAGRLLASTSSCFSYSGCGLAVTPFPLLFLLPRGSSWLPAVTNLCNQFPIFPLLEISGMVSVFLIGY